MPYKRSRSRTPFRKRRRGVKSRKRVARRSKALIYRRPVENCARRKLRYCDTISLNAAIGTVDKHIFRCNNIYDPDYTGVGHQPMGYNEMEAMYQHYVVESATIYVRYTSQVTTPTTGASHVGIILEDDLLTPTSYNTLVETQRGVNTIVTPSGTKTTTLKKHFDLRKFFCVKGVDIPSKYSGTTGGTLPEENAFWTLWQSGISTSEDAAGIFVDVMIEYNVKFFEPRNMSGS